MFYRKLLNMTTSELFSRTRVTANFLASSENATAAILMGSVSKCVSCTGVRSPLPPLLLVLQVPPGRRIRTLDPGTRKA